MKSSIISIIIGAIQVAIAAAPTGAVNPPHEYLAELVSVIAETPFETDRKTITATLTGYSSTVDQTDDTPFLTASNTSVRDGVVAANFLPIGTKIQIPKLFGNKVFVVEDRMHQRFNDRIDIWFADRELAKQFGLRKATVVVFEG
ncbi:MAG: hypothetical protein AAB518_00765 [Patescibacteria group bacterium]